MILAPRRCYEGLTAYEADDSFIVRLKAYDAALSAYRNNREQTIVVFSDRRGIKSLEFKAKRNDGVFWRDLEDKIIRDLPAMDVWKRFGSAKSFDQWLHDQVEEEKQAKLKRNKEDRLDRLKEDVERTSLEAGLRVPKVNVPFETKGEH